MFVRSLCEVGRRRQVETLHHLHERRPLAPLQPRIGGDFLADCRVGPVLVVVGRINLQRRVELQEPPEQAVVQRFGIAGGKVGAASAPDEQCVAGEDAVVGNQAHRVRGVPGRMQHLEPQLAQDHHLAVIDA